MESSTNRSMTSISTYLRVPEEPLKHVQEYRKGKSTLCPYNRVTSVLLEATATASLTLIKTKNGCQLSASLFHEPKTWLPVSFRIRHQGDIGGMLSFSAALVEGKQKGSGS